MDAEDFKVGNKIFAGHYHFGTYLSDFAGTIIKLTPTKIATIKFNYGEQREIRVNLHSRKIYTKGIYANPYFGLYSEAENEKRLKTENYQKAIRQAYSHIENAAKNQSMYDIETSLMQLKELLKKDIFATV